MNMNRYADCILRWRWLFIALSLLLVVLTGSGLARLQFSGDYRDFFHQDDPQLKAYQLIQDAYANDSNALVVFAPTRGTVFEARTLQAMATFTEQAWKLPFARRVDGLSNFQHTEVHGDDLVVRNLVPSPALGLTPEQLAAIRNIALHEPLLLNRLVAPGGKVAGVNISFNLPKRAETEIPEAVAALRQLMAHISAKYPEIRLHATGALLLDNAFDEQAQADLATLTPLMYLFIALVLFLSLRSLLGVLATLLVLTFSVLVAVGAMGLLGLKLTAISVSAPTILMTITVANCMHFLLYLMQRMGAGDSKPEAIRHTLQANVPLLAIACGTDALGFFSMMLSDVPPIAGFGVVLGIGAIAVFVFSVVFLPALAAVLPLRGRHDLQQQGRWLGASVVRLLDYRALVFGLALLLNGVALYFVLQIRFEDNFVNYFSPGIEFRRDTDQIARDLTGVHEIVYSVPGRGPGSVATPEYLHRLDQFSSWLRQQPEVFSVSSLSDIVKRINRTMNGGSAAAYRIPAAPDATAQLLLLFEMSLPPGLELNDQIRVDRSASKLTVVVRNISSAELLAFDRRVQQWVDRELPPWMKTQGSGPSIMFSHIGERNVSGMMQGYLLQILIISAVIGVLLRSLSLGVISLIPNVLPSLLAFGLWGAFVGHIGLSVAVVAVLTYGIIVDDTIHSIFKYHHARRHQGMAAREALAHVYSVTGMSVLLTTTVLVIGFGVLMFSGFDLNADLGVMSALTIAIAAIVDLLLLPPLLYTLDQWRRTPQASAIPASPLPVSPPATAPAILSPAPLREPT